MGIFIMFKRKDLYLRSLTSNFHLTIKNTFNVFMIATETTCTKYHIYG